MHAQYLSVLEVQANVGLSINNARLPVIAISKFGNILFFKWVDIEWRIQAIVKGCGGVCVQGWSIFYSRRLYIYISYAGLSSKLIAKIGRRSILLKAYKKYKQNWVQ